ncbi:hypothetical protein PAMP_018837 [Pampus punctatissimus]
MKGFKLACTASNSNKSTPACSPVLRKRSRSPTPQSQEGENMVEKGSDHSSDKSPSTPEQVVQRTYSLQSARSGGKNSKVRHHETIILRTETTVLPALSRMLNSVSPPLNRGEIPDFSPQCLVKGRIGKQQQRVSFIAAATSIRMPIFFNLAASFASFLPAESNRGGSSIKCT